MLLVQLRLVIGQLDVAAAGRSTSLVAAARVSVSVQHVVRGADCRLGLSAVVVVMVAIGGDKRRVGPVLTQCQSGVVDAAAAATQEVVGVMSVVDKDCAPAALLGALATLTTTTHDDNQDLSLIHI